MLDFDLVSVVILSWNRRDDLREGLLELRRQSYPSLEVIVVDNGSTDGTPAMVRSEFPEVQLVIFPENIGIEAYNSGFRRAKGRYILILDDDSFPARNAIARMVDRFEADPRLGVVAFHVHGYDRFQKDSQESNREDRNGSSDGSTVAECGPIRGSAHAFPSGKHRQDYYFISFNGATAGVRRSVMEEVGYYPGEFFLFCNEIDLALRIWDAG